MRPSVESAGLAMLRALGFAVTRADDGWRVRGPLSSVALPYHTAELHQMIRIVRQVAPEHPYLRAAWAAYAATLPDQQCAASDPGGGDPHGAVC